MRQVAAEVTVDQPTGIESANRGAPDMPVASVEPNATPASSTGLLRQSLDPEKNAREMAFIASNATKITAVIMVSFAYNEGFTNTAGKSAGGEHKWDGLWSALLGTAILTPVVFIIVYGGLYFIKRRFDWPRPELDRTPPRWAIWFHRLLYKGSQSAEAREAERRETGRRGEERREAEAAEASEAMIKPFWPGYLASCAIPFLIGGLAGYVKWDVPGMLLNFLTHGRPPTPPNPNHPFDAGELLPLLGLVWLLPLVFYNRKRKKGKATASDRSSLSLFSWPFFMLLGYLLSV